MTHAAGSDSHDETANNIDHFEHAHKMTKEVLEDPESESKVRAGLVKAGRVLRERAQEPGTRQELAKRLLNALTPEQQKEFIENTQTFTHALAEGMKNNVTGGLRNMWKAAAPSLLPADWVTLETFNEDELKTYIAFGAMDVEEHVASLVDSEVKDKAALLRTLSIAIEFIPEVGPVLAEISGTLGHLAEAPGEYLERTLPLIRTEVRAMETLDEREAA